MEYSEDPFDLWRLLIHSVRRRIRGMGTVLDASNTSKLLAAMTFSFAFNCVLKMVSDPRLFPPCCLGRAITMFDLLQWDEERFQFE